MADRIALRLNRRGFLRGTLGAAAFAALDGVPREALGAAPIEVLDRQLVIDDAWVKKNGRALRNRTFVAGKSIQCLQATGHSGIVHVSTTLGTADSPIVLEDLTILGWGTDAPHVYTHSRWDSAHNDLKSGLWPRARGVSVDLGSGLGGSKGPYGVSHVVLRGIYVAGVPQAAVNFLNCHDDVLIEPSQARSFGVYAHHCFHGIMIGDADHPERLSRDVRIRGCIFENTWGPSPDSELDKTLNAPSYASRVRPGGFQGRGALNLSSVNQAGPKGGNLVEDVEFRGEMFAGIKLSQACDNLTIRRCHGAHFTAQNSIAPRCRNLRVSRCTFAAPMADGWARWRQARTLLTGNVDAAFEDCVFLNAQYWNPGSDRRIPAGVEFAHGHGLHVADANQQFFAAATTSRCLFGSFRGDAMPPGITGGHAAVVEEGCSLDGDATPKGGAPTTGNESFLVRRGNQFWDCTAELAQPQKDRRLLRRNP